MSESFIDPAEHIIPDPRGNGVERIAAERLRQILKLGFDDKHDDRHEVAELAMAAACYAAPRLIYERHDFANGTTFRDPWPWDVRFDARYSQEHGNVIVREWRSVEDRVEELVAAGALIAAEVDRLLRSKVKLGGKGGNDVEGWPERDLATDHRAGDPLSGRGRFGPQARRRSPLRHGRRACGRRADSSRRPARDLQDRPGERGKDKPGKRQERADMKRAVVDSATGKELRQEDREPACNVDFCEDCGNCLYCYSDVICPANGAHGHRWILVAHPDSDAGGQSKQGKR
jgi:hypothetical protein